MKAEIKIGLTMNEFCEIKSELKKELVKNSAIYCGDIDEVIATTINKTIQKIKNNNP